MSSLVFLYTMKKFPNSHRYMTKQYILTMKNRITYSTQEIRRCLKGKKRRKSLVRIAHKKYGFPITSPYSTIQKGQNKQSEKTARQIHLYVRYQSIKEINTFIIMVYEILNNILEKPCDIFQSFKDILCKQIIIDRTF